MLHSLRGLLESIPCELIGVLRRRIPLPLAGLALAKRTTFFTNSVHLPNFVRLKLCPRPFPASLAKFAAIFHASSRVLLWVFRSQVVWNANVRIIKQV